VGASRDAVRGTSLLNDLLKGSLVALREGPILTPPFGHTCSTTNTIGSWQSGNPAHCCNPTRGL